MHIHLFCIGFLASILLAGCTQESLVPAPQKMVLYGHYAKDGYQWSSYILHAPDAQEHWIEVQSHFIDSLTVQVEEQHRIHTAYTLTPRHSVAGLPFLSHHYFVFRIRTSGLAFIHLRGYVRPPEVIKMPVHSWEPDEFIAYYQRDNWLWAVFAGMVLMAVFLSLATYFFDPRKIYIYYASYLLCMAIYALLNDGWGSYLPDWLHFLDDSLAIGYWLNAGLGFFLLFSYQFLNIQSSRWWVRLSPVLITGLFMCVLLVLHYFRTASLSEWYQLLYIGSLSLFICIYSLCWGIYIYDAIRRKFRPVWLLMAAAGIMLFFYGYNVTSNIGWTPHLFSDMLLFRLGIVYDILVISIGWVYRQHLYQQEQKALREENNLRQKETYEARQHQQEEMIRSLQLQNQLQHQRERLARDLHDGIGSQLTHIITRLDVMDHHPMTVEQLHALSDFARDTNQLLRETIWVLHQEQLTFGALSHRVRNWLVHLWEDRPTPHLHTHIDGLDHVLLAPEVASALFRIAQEAVTNALKYAHASQLTICFTTDAHTVTLLIADDGKGFEPTSAIHGYGLTNMQRRTEELAGTFLLHTSESGTKISIQMPVSQ